MTRIEAVERINEVVAGCFAYTTSNGIEVTYRGKKSNKIRIENGSVTCTNFQCSAAAHQIAELLGLEVE